MLSDPDRNVTELDNVVARKKPQGLCIDVGNVLLMPDVAVVAASLAAASPRRVDQQRFYEAVVLADRDGHLTLDPAAFWDSDDMALAWGRYVGLGPADSVRIWSELVEADSRGPEVWTKVNPDAAFVLDALTRNGVRLAAVSNACGFVAEELAAAGLASFFTTVIDSAIIGSQKPDPRIFVAAADALSLAPSECWHVEDTAYELSGAERAGFSLAVQYDPLVSIR